MPPWAARSSATKLFFFGSYQGTRQVNGLDTTSTSNPILPPLTNDRSAAALAAQFCPANHPLDSRYLTFAGGKQLDCRNQTTATTAPINPVALGMLQLKTKTGDWLVPESRRRCSPRAATRASASPLTACLPPTTRTNTSSTATIWRRPGTRSPRASISPPSISTAPSVPRRAIRARRWFRARALRKRWPPATMSPASTSPRAFRKTLVNEARMSFTRSTQSAHGDGTPSATALGMTPADRFFDQPPEMNVLGPLGSFRVFGTPGNDFATENKYYSWTDNLSWVHGSHRTRAGGFFLDAKQRTRRPRHGARQALFPDLQRFPAGAQRRRQSQPLGTQQHSVRAGQRRRRAARRSAIPLPQLLRRGLRAERLQS